MRKHASLIQAVMTPSLIDPTQDYGPESTSEDEDATTLESKSVGDDDVLH